MQGIVVALFVLSWISRFFSLSLTDINETIITFSASSADQCSLHNKTPVEHWLFTFSLIWMISENLDVNNASYLILTETSLTAQS